jgi:hypothetical protein
MSRTYFNSILDHYLNLSLLILSLVYSQAIIGLYTGKSSIIITSGRLIFSNLSATTLLIATSLTDYQDWHAIFANSTNYNIPYLVVNALIYKLSKTNSALDREFNLCKPLAAYRVDSLLAVKLRSWLAKESRADVALFKIQGGVRFKGLARTVVARSLLRKVEG